MKKIDSYAIDINKALVFIFSSLVITVISIVFFIVPTMQDFKVSKINNRHAKKKFVDTKAYYEQRLQELKDLTKTNKRVIESLHSAFDEEAFNKNMSIYLSNLMVEYEEREDSSLYFNSRDLNVSGEFPNPNSFFNSIKSLNQFKNTVSIEFPIIIKTERGQKLSVVFPATEYSLKDLNSTFDGNGLK